MIRVLHIISDKNIGGAGILLLNQLTASDRKNFLYSVALPKGSMLTERIKALGINTFEADLTLTGLLPVIKLVRPHIIHTHACAKARIAARLCGVKAINTRHCAPDTSEPVSLIRKAANRIFDALFTHKTIATAHYVKTRLINESIPPHKISVIINGSVPKQVLNSNQRKEARKKWGFDQSHLIVGIVGRLEKGKGQEYFIEAARLCSDCDEMKFIIAGDGSMKNQLMKQAKGLANIKFAGFIEDISEIMNVIDVNVNLSYISETSSLSLSEGMSVGAVPIVSDCGGNSFVVGDCGIVIPKRDSQALASALKSLYSDRSRLDELAKKSRNRFFKRLTAEAMTKETEAVYKSLIE